MNTELSITKSQQELAAKLNSSVFNVLDSANSGKLQGFERAFLIANAVEQLKALLTPEYMKPIMALSGNRLGFLTDRDNEPEKDRYSMAVVKNCLIEAVLMGVQPFGNQFNIIAGNCYITKEGCGQLLSNLRSHSKPDLVYEILPGLPRINAEKTSAAVLMKIEWTIGGVVTNKEIDFPIRVNKYMGADGVIGKANRKARSWLYNRIADNGIEITDGDTQDVDYKIMNDKKAKATLEEVQEQFDKNKSLLSDKELVDAQRIIDGKEVDNYQKLLDLLKSK